MGLTVEGIGSHVSSQSNATLISPAAASDTELASLLSGSKDLKITNNDSEKIGEVMTNNNKTDVSDVCLNSAPALLGSLTTSLITKNKAFAIAGLVVAVTTVLTNIIKSKKAATANA